MKIRTKDLNYAAYLSVTGNPMSGIKYEGNVCYWTFDAPRSNEEMYEEFLTGSVPAARYANEIRALKTQAMRGRSRR